MPVVNAETGETVVGASGLHILFTVDAWLLAESSLGKGALAILHGAAQMQFGFRDAQALLWAGGEGWRRRHAPGAPVVTPERAMEIIEAQGLMSVVTDLAGAIMGSKALGAGTAPEADNSGPLDSGSGGPSSSAHLHLVPTPSA